MKYAETPRIEAGLRFKSSSGLVVETTGQSLHVVTHHIGEVYVHEVTIVEGLGSGSTFLHNLDAAEAL